MFSLLEPFSAAVKAGYEVQLAMMAELTGTAFEGMAKVMELNLNTLKNSIEDSRNSTKQLMSASTPQEWLALRSAQAQPAVEKIFDYGHHMASIASHMQTEIGKTAEAHMANANRKASALLDEVAKNAPAGSESSVAAVRSAMDSAHAGHALFDKVTKQALDGQFAAATQLTKNHETTRNHKAAKST